MLCDATETSCLHTASPALPRQATTTSPPPLFTLSVAAMSTRAAAASAMRATSAITGLVEPPSLASPPPCSSVRQTSIRLATPPVKAAGLSVAWLPNKTPLSIARAKRDQLNLPHMFRPIGLLVECFWRAEWSLNL